MRISDWSSDVCSSDLDRGTVRGGGHRSVAAFGGDRARVRVDVQGRDPRAVRGHAEEVLRRGRGGRPAPAAVLAAGESGRASCRERVCQYVYISVVAVSLQKKNNTIQPK